jgi:hypothetical protein
MSTGVSFSGDLASGSRQLRFGIESVGTRLLWCGLVAGAVGGYVGSEMVGWGSRKGANIIFEHTYPLNPP